VKFIQPFKGYIFRIISSIISDMKPNHATVTTWSSGAVTVDLLSYDMTRVLRFALGFTDGKPRRRRTYTIEGDGLAELFSYNGGGCVELRVEAGREAVLTVGSKSITLKPTSHNGLARVFTVDGWLWLSHYHVPLLHKYLQLARGKEVKLSYNGRMLTVRYTGTYDEFCVRVPVDGVVRTRAEQAYSVTDTLVKVLTPRIDWTTSIWFNKRHPVIIGRAASVEFTLYYAQTPRVEG